MARAAVPSGAATFGGQPVTFGVDVSGIQIFGPRMLEFVPDTERVIIVDDRESSIPIDYGPPSPGP